MSLDNSNSPVQNHPNHAVVEGIDLEKEKDKNKLELLKQVVMNKGVAVVKGQDLSDEGFYNFASTFKSKKKNTIFNIF